MPSVFSRLLSLFPGFQPRATPEQRVSLVKRTREELANTPRRPFASTEERVPALFHGGVAGKVWFLPYADSATEDTPDIRAAMRLMRRDPYVKAAWEPQILTVASEDWQIAASEEGNPDAEEQAEFVQRMIEDYTAGGMPQLVRSIAAPWGSEGHGIAEKVWGVARKGRLEGQIVLEALKAKDSDRTIRLEGDRFHNVRWVSSKSNSDRFPIEEFVYTRYMTVFDEPLGQAAFRPAYASYWMRDTVRKLRMIHHEKRMAGMLVGTYAADDDRAPLEVALAKAKTATWMAIPEGTRVEAVNLSTASEPDYKSFDESLRDETVTGIAFATLQILMGSVPDARGDSKVQKAIFDLAPWLVMTLVTDAINTQVIPDAIDYNFPFPAAGAYPKLTFGAVSNAELLEQIQIVEGAQRIGFDNLSKKHYVKALSLKLADPNDPDDVLAPAGQGGMFGGMGGGGFGGGMGAAIPPGTPPDAGGGVVPFADADPYWEFREPAEWNPHPNKPGYMISKRGRVLSNAAYAKFKRKAAKSPPSPASATSPANAPRPGPARATPPVWVPGAPVGPAGGGEDVDAAAPRGGRVRRGLAAAKKYAKRKYEEATARNLGMRQARLAKRAAIRLQRIGRRIKRFKTLDRWIGIGSTIEKMATRALRRARVVYAAYKDRGAKAGAKAQAREAARGIGTHWKESRRKYGVVGGAVLESAVWVANWVVKPAAMGSAYLAAASAAPIPGLGVLFKMTSMALSPIVRGLLEFPFRVAVRAQGAGVTKIRKTLVESGRYSESFAEDDPMEMVIDLRRRMDDERAAEGMPPSDLTDEQLIEILEAGLAHAESIIDSAGLPAEAFSEVHRFGWTPAKSRSGGLKAVGTGEDQGKKPKYGKEAQRVLGREGRKAADPSRPVIEPGKAPEPVSPASAGSPVIEPKDEGRRELEDVATRAAQGDPEATKKLGDAGQATIEQAVKGLASAPPPKPEEAAAVRSAWGMAAQGAMGDLRAVGRGVGAASGGLYRAAKAAVDTVGKFLSGLWSGVRGKDWEGGFVRKAGHLAGWLARQPLKAAKVAVKALFRFAKAVATEVGGDVWAGVKAAWPTVRPFAWWAASVALGLGLAVGPAAAGILIGTPNALTMALALSPIGMSAGVLAVRRLGRKVAGAGLSNRVPGVWQGSEGYGCGRVHRFGDLPPDGTAGEVALAGKDGERAARLLSSAKAQGVNLLADLTRTAVTRMMASPDPLSTPVLFADEELKGIQRSFAESIAAADLLGRARVRERARLAESRRFAESDPDDDDPFTAFADPVPALPPREAVGYFGRLVPSLGTDAARYGPLLDRHAFTLAVAADQSVLERVKAAIANRMAGGGDGDVPPAADIEAILEEAGVSHRNPQYAEMVWRTNAMDALNQGAMAELQHPEMREFFPAWRYEGIDDDRAGDDHRPNFGRYFPTDMSFAEVRGPRVWNCRCALTPVSKYDWDGLAKRGVRFG